MGAKIVDFSGWDMPIHYGSQLEEHHAVRREAGMFDVSHMLPVDVTGAGAREYLRALLANDVDRLGYPGKALYSCMLKPDGGVVDDLIVYGFGAEDYRVVVNAGTADKDLSWMRGQAQQLRGTNVSITARRDLAMVAVQGPQARERFWQAVPSARQATETLKTFSAARVDDLFIARTGYTGEDGFEVMGSEERIQRLWDALLAAGVRPCGLGARDTLRLEAGMNLYGQDMDEAVSPLDAGLAWTVDLRDPARVFVGRQALESDGSRAAFLGLVLLDKGVLRAHQKISTPAGAGETTSGSFSPTLGQSIALARLPLSTNPGDTVQVQIRDKLLNARVVRPPFVRNGKALV